MDSGYLGLRHLFPCGAFTYLGKQESSRPPVGVLVFIGLLLTATIGLIEILFLGAEAILILSGLEGTPFGAFGGLLLAGLGLFLLSFDLAYWIYVYRVYGAPQGEVVRLNILPWEGYGLLR